MNAYIQKNVAEHSSNRNFPSQKFNDEGDAFRHFIWAGLLTKELGEDKAKAFLDAHEEDTDQPVTEKSMDLANNRGGILASLKLIRENRFSKSNLEQMALDEMRAGHLIIINPGLTIPKEPK